MRAHAHGLTGLSRIPEAVVWLAEGEMEDRRSPEAADLLGDLPLLAALRASSLARAQKEAEHRPKSVFRAVPRAEHGDVSDHLERVADRATGNVTGRARVSYCAYRRMS